MGSAEEWEKPLRLYRDRRDAGEIMEGSKSDVRHDAALHLYTGWGFRADLLEARHE